MFFSDSLENFIREFAGLELTVRVGSGSLLFIESRRARRDIDTRRGPWLSHSPFVCDSFEPFGIG